MTSVQASNSAEFDTTTTNTTNNQATVPTEQRSATLETILIIFPVNFMDLYP